MKVKFTLFVLLMCIISAYAQDDKFKHFEIEAGVMFWTPISMHLKSVNSVTQVNYPDGTYLSSGSFSGYGTSIAPGLQAKYYFENNFGLALGFNLIHMDSELSVNETETTYTGYENMADIANFTFGFTGKYLSSDLFQFFYEAGIDLVANYSFTIHNSNSTDLDANSGPAIGLYCKTGVNIKLFRAVYFNTALCYSYIPAEIEYVNNDYSVKINEKTNLGGIALQTGLAFNF
jgi:outer membrane protein W